MFDRNISCYRYSGGMQKTVLNFKFNGRTELCRFMSDEMAVLAAQRYDGIAFDAVTYVPMPRLRQAMRGYNQSQLLADRIADRMGLPLVCTLKRKLTFDTQKKNSRTDRFTKIRNQFKVRGDVDGKTFLLVDDVITTGATLSECALTLKRAGAGKVFCVTFASTYKK